MSWLTPSARVTELAHEHRVAMDGKPGVRFSANLHVIFAKGLNCQFIVWLEDSSGKPLTTQDAAYRNDAGAMWCLVPFTPTGDQVVQPVSVFIPYEVISTTPGITGVFTIANVWSLERQRYIASVSQPDWFCLTNGAVDQKDVDREVTDLKNKVIQQLKHNIQTLQILTGVYPSVYETLIREAINMNPGDRIIRVR